MASRYDPDRAIGGKERLFRPIFPAMVKHLQSQVDLLKEERKKRSRPKWDILVGYTPESANLYPHKEEIWLDAVLKLFLYGDKRASYTLCRSHIQMACSYTNTKHNRNGRHDVPVCAVTDALFWNEVVQKGPQHGSESLSRRICNNWQPCLRGYNLPPERFKKVKYLFIPSAPNPHHQSLLVISPLNKTVEHLDSDDNAMENWSQWIDGWRYPYSANGLRFFRLAFNLLAIHLKKDFIPHEWRYRDLACEQQGYTSNCTFFTSTNAACLAFGYPLLNPHFDIGSYPLSYWMNRRKRVAIDLFNGGFQDKPEMDPNEDPALANDKAARDEAIRKTWSIYPTTEYNEGNSGSEEHPFCAISDEIMRALPIKVRARTGKYDKYIRRELEERCANKPKTYKAKEWRKMRHRPPGEIREWMEVCDLQARRQMPKMTWGGKAKPWSSFHTMYRRGSGSEFSDDWISCQGELETEPETDSKAASPDSSLPGPWVPW